MNIKSIISFVAIAIATPLLATTPEEYLTDLTSGALKPQQVAQSQTLSDGEHYSVISPDQTKIIAYNYRTGKPTDTILDLETLPDAPIRTIEQYKFNSRQTHILLHSTTTPIYRHSYTTTYYLYEVKNKSLQPLSEMTEKQQTAIFSPNGRMVAFTSGNNIYLRKLDYNTELQITDDGKLNHIINGTADWVYEEEFGEVQYMQWSPDNTHLAWLRFDESAMKQFTFSTYHHPYDSVYTYKYPKAGETNSSVTIKIHNVQNHKTNEVDCGDNIYLPILRWSNDPQNFIVARLNRNQNQLDLIRINALSTVKTTILTEKSNTYVDYGNYKHIRFNSDNSFIILSERDGYRHIYHYDFNGNLINQLTKGEWEVTNYYTYDEKSKTAYFQAAKEHPSQRHIYKVNAKGKLTNLDPRPGTHSAIISADTKYIIAEFNNITTPNQYSLLDNNGKRIRTILDNSELQAKHNAYNLPQKEFINFTTDEGVLLHGWILRPNDFDPNKKYPLVMVQYSGPNSQEALNRFKQDWEYFIVQKGYVVACVDPRGTGAKGNAFRTATYLQLGKYETEDQVAAAKYFGKLPYIDKDRIAIWGWSYGGFMALNCLSHSSKVFKAGISIAPVTDWRLYNTAYTERFMQTPQENFRGYEISDLIPRAKDLNGNLLIMHGTSDDNVHIQHTMLYVDALVEAGKQFEMQIYPNKNHSILGAKTRYHLYTRIANFLNTNL